jgi:hypothetical protein
MCRLILSDLIGSTFYFLINICNGILIKSTKLSHGIKISGGKAQDRLRNVANFDIPQKN